MFKYNHGITLIEILIVIAIMAVIGAATIPLSQGFLVRNYLTNATNELVSSLRIAQLNSLAGKEGSQWGVKITSNKIIMFKGSVYIDPGTVFDHQYDLPQSLTITQQELFFNKLTGNPNTTAVITITNNTGDSETITVNEVGTIDVQ